MNNPEIMSDIAKAAMQKVGWLVFRLQQMERMLKFLVANADISGPADEIEQRIQSQADSVVKKTMGNLVGELHESIYGDDVPPEISEEVTRPDSAFRFRAGSSDEATVESWKEELSQLVEGRNQLIHHQLHDFDPECDDSCQKLIARLEVLDEMIQPVYERLQGHMRFLKGIFSSMDEINRVINESYSEWLSKKKED